MTSSRDFSLMRSSPKMDPPASGLRPPAKIAAGRDAAYRPELGFSAYDPAADDVAAAVAQVTDGAGAEVVFEVSGSAAGILAATQHASLRGRIVVVAIYPEPKPVALFDLFWKELELRGARVYEPEDFEAAIALLATSATVAAPHAPAGVPLPIQ